MLKAVSRSDSTISLSQRTFLGLGYFSSFMMVTCVSTLATPFYQMTLHVDPFWLGVALTVPLLFGAILGLFAGNISDNFHSRLGRRRPFLIVFSWVAGVSFGLLWMVSTDWTERMQLTYLGFTLCIFYFACAFYSVPLDAMAYEAAEDTHERTRLFAFVAYFSKCGSLLYQWVFPLAQLSVFGGVVVGVKYVGWGLGIIVMGVMGMLPGLLMKSKTILKRAPPAYVGFKKSIKSVLIVSRMRALLIIVVVVTGVIASVAKMDYYLLVYFMFDGDLEQGSVWKAVLSSGYAVFGILYLPVLVKVSSILGTIQTFRWVFLLSAIGGGLKWFIFSPGVTWLLLVDALLCGPVWAAMVVLLPTLISDLVVDNKEAHGGSQAGAYASVYNSVHTFCGVCAVLMAGAALNWVNFDITQAERQGDSTFFSMRLILSGGTVIASLIAYQFCAVYLRARESMANVE